MHFAIHTVALIEGKLRRRQCLAGGAEAAPGKPYVGENTEALLCGDVQCILCVHCMLCARACVCRT